MSIVSTLVKGLNKTDTKKLTNILNSIIQDHKTKKAGRSLSRKKLNERLRATAYLFKNPQTNYTDIEKKFDVSAKIREIFRKHNLSSSADAGNFKPATLEKIKKLRESYFKYIDKYNTPPSKTELAEFAGFKTKRVVDSSGVIQRRNIIFDIEKTSQRSGIKNPFDDLNFHDGSFSRTGGSTEMQRLKAEALSKFYADPDIPKEVKKIRRDIDKTLREYNKLFPFDKKVIDHIDSYWNAAAKEVPYEDVANWQLISKKINGIKAALYENPKSGLQYWSKELKKAKGRNEQKFLLARFDEQMTKHRKLVDDSEVILKLEGIDGIP